jgi:hypothetical protein
MPKNRDVERELSEREAEERRRGATATPPDHAPERALDAEPGVEWHAGEDAGEVPAPDEGGADDDELAPPSPP